MEGWPAAAILLTGLSASGKTTLSRALIRRLNDLGIKDVVLIDGEELRERLPRRYGHSLSDREEVWRELVKESSKELEAGKVVVIAAIAHRASMRAMARKRLQPFFEVHLDCPVEVCAARDVKGQYQRAFAAEYDCFIGVTHPYEQTDPELRLDTAALSQPEAETLLWERVIHFLATADVPNGPPPGEWLRRFGTRVFIDKVPTSLWEIPSFRNGMLKAAQARKPVARMERPGCAQLFVMFGGVDVGNAPGEDESFNGYQIDFLRASGLLRRNLMYIRDPYLDNFTRGISEEVPDMDSLADYISIYARSLSHVRQIHALGYSSGSYGALALGHLSRVDTVWAFSPRSVRHYGLREAMQRLRDMLSVHNGVTQYNILYSAGNKRDKEFADWLTDCPGVTIRPFQEFGDNHALIWYLAYHGMLRDILPPFVPADARPAVDATNDYKDGSESA